MFQAVYWLPLLLLWVDDWLTGDDDRWNRFKSRARNAVKWKMALPVPPPRTA